MAAAAIYVRQSEDKTGQEAAVQRQEAACRMLAEAKGWNEPRLYADNSISATSGKSRPQFEKLIKDIDSGAVDRVVVWHLDRLTRSMKDLTQIIEAGQQHRVNISSVHGVSLDLGDATGVAVAQILTAVAAMEVQHKGERQKAANRQRAAQGKAFWTRRPFGYDRNDGGVFIVEAEADLIRKAAVSVLEGSTLASIARGWNAAGFRTTDVRRDKDTGEITKNGGLWGVTQVRRLLLNPRYAGKRMYNGEEMEHDGDWDSILDPELLEQLELKLTDPRRRTAPDDLNTKYLLSGIATCGKCGGKMYAYPAAGHGKRYMAYRCMERYCTLRRMDQVDEVVERVVIGLLSRPDAAEVYSRGEDLASLRAEAVVLRDRRDSLAALLAEGVLSAASVREQAAKITTKLTSLELDIAHAEGMHPAAAVLAAPDVGGAWRRLPLGNQRQILRSLIDVSIMPAGKGIRFSADHIRITPRTPLQRT